MTIQTKDIMTSLPLLASVLGNKYGVRVNISGDKACTDGKTIHLPSLPLDCDAEFVLKIRSYLDHEAAHIRHTDFEALRMANLNPVQKYLWNSLEDWRVENELSKIFMGCKAHFQWLIKEHFETPKHEEKAGQNPAFSILHYVLLTVRAWDVPSLENVKQREEQIIIHNYSGLKERIDKILLRVRQHCQSTQDCIDYALDLYATIKSYVQDIFKESNEQDSSDTGGTERTDARQEIENFLKASEDEIPLGLGESLGQSIEQEVEKQNIHKHAPTLSVAIAGHKASQAFDIDMQSSIQQSSVALRTRLHGLLQTQTQQPCIIGRKGKVQPSKLHRLASKNPKVFLKRGEKTSISTAVHLLLDCSGSMDGTRIKLACQACYALAITLEQCRGVNVGITAFPAQIYEQSVAVFPVVKHGQKVHDRFAITARGCTPLTESLWWVMQQMCILKENRKIILILTDGVPDSLYTAKHAITQAQKLGLEVLALGIEDNSLEMLLPKTSRTIYDLEMLPTTLFSMLQQTLLI